ncbi:hypothetical protein C8Q76DRAFT_348048 [Earliella scabrosa]|nr:hypothetical protein C8Q76DRAFT_348048 [Earliella scabrosa]
MLLTLAPDEHKDSARTFASESLNLPLVRAVNGEDITVTIGHQTFVFGGTGGGVASGGCVGGNGGNGGSAGPGGVGGNGGNGGDCIVEGGGGNEETGTPSEGRMPTLSTATVTATLDHVSTLSTAFTVTVTGTLDHITSSPLAVTSSSYATATESSTSSTSSTSPNSSTPESSTPSPTTTTTTASSSGTAATGSPTDSNTGTSPGVIVAIVAVIITLLVILAAMLLWIRKQNKRVKASEKFSQYAYSARKSWVPASDNGSASETDTISVFRIRPAITSLEAMGSPAQPQESTCRNDHFTPTPQTGQGPGQLDIAPAIQEPILWDDSFDMEDGRGDRLRVLGPQARPRTHEAYAPDTPATVPRNCGAAPPPYEM